MAAESGIGLECSVLEQFVLERTDLECSVAERFRLADFDLWRMVVAAAGWD